MYMFNNSVGNKKELKTNLDKYRTVVFESCRM